MLPSFVGGYLVQLNTHQDVTFPEDICDLSLIIVHLCRHLGKAGT